MSPLPSNDLVGVLQALVAALQSLVTVLSQQAAAANAPGGPAGVSAGASALADPATAGLPPVGGPPGAGGCGCGGAMGAATGAAAAPPAPVFDGAVPVPEPTPVPAPALEASGPLVSGPERHSAKENAQVVADVAREQGVDPVLAVAMMLIESGGDNTNRSGDGGTSFGLFQLHEGGMLPRDWYRGQPGHDNVYDPRKNAEISLGSLARYAQKTGKSGGALAAASQRPADPSGYAQKADAAMGRARELLG